MKFETTQDVLNWYEKQPRTLTDRFIGRISWSEVKNYPLDKKLVPVLLYMRDVEVLTDMYYEELRRTPTGRDPVIGKFMERWGVEEAAHGEVINRFLNEAGIETDRHWKSEVRRSVPKIYALNARILTTLTNLIGKKFTATHMTFGAIHEMSTGQGYRRLMKLADHPILSEILTAIMREESAHTKFYLSVAKLELQQSEFARRVSRFIVNRFWAPVGQGAKPKFQTDYTIGTLFGGSEGLDWIERNVSRKIRTLPGFADVNTISERVKRVVLPETAISGSTLHNIPSTR